MTEWWLTGCCRSSGERRLLPADEEDWPPGAEVMIPGSGGGVRREAMIEVRDLSFGYSRPDEIYSHFSWTVGAGEAWAVLGPSGCGKTTLVHLLAGLRRPTGGSIRIDGSEVTGPRTSTGLILQDHGLLPWARAWDNIALGLRIRRVPRDEIRARVSYWLERLGIDGVAGRYPGQLSGGQRQRVAIARTLALEPSLLLMDEPFSSLDSSTRENLQDLVVGLSEGTGMTTILVTHDIQEAVFLGKKILVVAGQQPLSSYRVVENPGARQPGYRRSLEFFERCAQVRDLTADMANPLPFSTAVRGQGLVG